MIIHFDEMQVNRDKGDYIPSDEELVELYDEYEHYEDTGRRTEHEEFWGAPCSITYNTCPECGEDISDEDEYTDDDEDEVKDNETD